MTIERTNDVSHSGLPPVETGNALTDFASGVWNGVKMPVDGARQLVGQDVNPYYSHSVPENAGMLVGQALAFIGTAALASKIPGAGRLAPVLAGGTLGFLAPTQGDQDVGTRLMRAGIAAGTVGIYSYGLGALGNHSNFARRLSKGSFAPFAIANHNMLEMGLSNPAPQYNEPKIIEGSQIGKLGPGDYRVRMQSQGQTREYDIHIPSGYDGKRPLATTLVLNGVAPAHGSYGVMTRETQFNKLADQQGVAVIYPYARDGHGAPLTGNVTSWNSEGTGLTNHDPKYDDMQFLDDVLKDAQNRVNIDNESLTAAGFSEGGMMLHKYASQRPGLFNGIAAIHGSMNGSEKLPTNPNDAPNVMVIHSTADYMLPYNGGRGLMTVTMDNASRSKPNIQAEAWARANGTDSASRSSTDIFTKTEYKRDGEARVVEYVIKGGNHAWDGSGTGGWPIVGRPLRRDQFDTSSVVWSFLRDADIKRSLEEAQPAKKAA
jgi:polyhydroxybutyrate depolymerase